MTSIINQNDSVNSAEDLPLVSIENKDPKPLLAVKPIAQLLMDGEKSQQKFDEDFGLNRGEELPDDDEGNIAAVSKKGKKDEEKTAQDKKSQKTKTKAAAVAPEDEIMPEPEEAKPKRGGKTKAAAVAPEDEIMPEPEQAKPKRGGKTEAAAVAPEDEIMPEPEQAKPKRGGKRQLYNVSKPAITEVDKQPAEKRTKRGASKAKSVEKEMPAAKPKTAKKAKEVEIANNGDDGEEKDVDEAPVKKSGRSKRAASTASIRSASAEPVEAEKPKRAATAKKRLSPVREKTPTKPAVAKKAGKGKAVQNAGKAAPEKLEEVIDDEEMQSTSKAAAKKANAKTKKETAKKAAPATVEPNDAGGRPKRGKRAEVEIPAETVPPKKSKKTKGEAAAEVKNGAEPKAAATKGRAKAAKKDDVVAEKVEPPKRGGRKRATPTIQADEEDDAVTAEGDGDAAQTAPSKTKAKKAALLNPTDTLYNKSDFELQFDGDTTDDKDEPRFNLKISSWNVAGLRSWLNKSGLTFLKYEEPDIFCLQEIKCTEDQMPENFKSIDGYHPYWNCKPGGYAGVALYSKIMPINIEYGIGDETFDKVGRMITAEYEKFFLINVYVPNSGRGLVNLEERMRWQKLFEDFVKRFDALKPVIIVGDMNVSHQEIDLANPKTNKRSAGFTQEERDKMTELLSMGFIDTYRHLYPDRKGAYTYWTYMSNARARNVGWRLDYFIVSERFLPRVVDNVIRKQCLGSDHCPITLFLKL